ncbi:hypothetical protein Afil01_08100 [Actinorhabdospora filicis]|uniref:DUF3052 domain-containing protein n=1 Tax=Actinorhabdospora filicis TaxID=1785913 RepID=A0A9W6SHB9_9ACTN|nr:DUF3052 domain-containing protein [Actinorhabdospora filicis]GLZ76003.1 hypothetical protein Afil01_08100 [Actinorhabdospora filicis]
MAGYSPTPLERKLGVKDGATVALPHRPAGFTLDLPPGASVVTSGADVTVAFYRAAAELRAEAPGLVTALADAASLWIAWPRRAAGHVSEITENLLREVFLPLGVVDVKVAALGEDWSGLKFVRRRELRA